MGKPSSKHGAGRTACSTKKSSQKSVMASAGKTTQKPQGATINGSKTQTITHSRSLSMAKASSNSMSTRSSSLKSMVVPAEVSGEALSGSMLVASWSPCPRVRSNRKVTSHKNTGTVACYPPPISKKGEAGPATSVSSRIIRKPARFQQQSEQLLDHALGSSGLGDHGHSTPQEVLCRCVRVRSSMPSVSGDSDLDMDATDNSAGQSLFEDVGSPPTPRVSWAASPAPELQTHGDDNLIKLEASQDELEALDNDAVSDASIDTSHETSHLQKQLQAKKKEIRKAQKSAKISQLQSQIAETDEQLVCLRHQAHNATPGEKSVPQPSAASTPSGNIDSQPQWLQQTELDIADAFLDQLDDTPTMTHEVPAKQSEQPAKSSNKCNKSKPLFQLPEQKQQ